MLRVAYDRSGLWAVMRGSRVIQRATTKGAAVAQCRALEVAIGPRNPLRIEDF